MRSTAWFLAVLVGTQASFAVIGRDANAGPAAEEVKQITSELVQAIARGDSATWDRYLAPDARFVSRDGRTYSRDELVAEIKPIQKGYNLGFEMADTEVIDHGDAAIVTFRTVEYLSIYGQKVDTDYRSTYVYFKRDGKWQLELFKYFEVPINPAPVAVAADVLRRYEGEYELAPGATTRVFVQDGRLMSQRGDRPAVELCPIDENRFFVKDREGETFFETGDDGRASALVYQRNYVNLRWSRVN